MGREKLPFLLNKENLIGAEIGVDLGLFSETLLKSCLFKEFYAIDSWPNLIPGVTQNGDQYYNHNNEITYQECTNKLKLYKECSIIRKSSIDAANNFKDSYFDFIFIDADHTFDGVLKDLETWYPKIKSGGILSGHDYFNMEMNCGNGIISNFRVKDAVDSFVDTYNVSLKLIEDEHGFYSWYFIKY